eukprot:3816739-Amphidinium_carterae.1
MLNVRGQVKQVERMKCESMRMALGNMEPWEGTSNTKAFAKETASSSSLTSMEPTCNMELTQRHHDVVTTATCISKRAALPSH